MQPEHRSDPGAASDLELPQARSLFDPAKHLLDPPPGVDRLGIAIMAGGAAVDGGAAAGLDVLRYVWRDGCDVQIGDELHGFVALVGSEGLLVGAGERTRHPHRCCPLAVADHGRLLAGHHQGVTVLHEAVPQIAEERPRAVGLSKEPGFSVAA
jgi:hypothetical protein